MVERRIKGCLGCQATTYKPVRDPLRPTPLPDRPWQRVDMDFWGPLPSGEYLLVIIDEYSRYPEVEFVRSTSAQAVIPHLDRIFSTHGFPEMAKTDGGPPFNGHGLSSIHAMGGHTQRCSEPRGPRSQRTSRELHENNEQSLAHRPYRRKEPSARALQIPQTLSSHTTQLHGKSTRRSSI